MTTNHQSLVDAAPEVYWLQDAETGLGQRPAVHGVVAADLVIVGGGYTGLWAALMALEEQPGRRVTVVEQGRVGHGASGRNGGFCLASLTHGALNGKSHWPNEMAALQRLAVDNFDHFASAIERHGIEADFEQTGTLDIATEPWQVEELAESITELAEVGLNARLLDQAETQAQVHSPTYLASVETDEPSGLVDPARLAWGLADAVAKLGGRIYENSPVTSISRQSGAVRVELDQGSVVANHCLVATNAWAKPVRAMGRYMVPVYDYALMTEPLSVAQMQSIGWENRQGLGDVSNQFHYYRLTADNRILFGGYDAIYRFGSRIDPAIEQQGTTHDTLAHHFFSTFPQLEGARFTHKWAGPIATTSRFTATWGRAHGGSTVWVGGYTGLGVVASRFGARVALDLLAGIDNELTQLRMVQRKPIPFPPEPLRWAGIELTRRAISKADRNQGRRGVWLKTLDQFGIGFDS